MGQDELNEGGKVKRPWPRGQGPHTRPQGLRASVNFSANNIQGEHQHNGNPAQYNNPERGNGKIKGRIY